MKMQRDTDICQDQDAVGDTGCERPHWEKGQLKDVHFWYPTCYKSTQGLEPSTDQQQLLAQDLGWRNEWLDKEVVRWRDERMDG